MVPGPSSRYEGRVFSPYIIVPKKSGGLRPILGLRILNWAFHKPPFKMLMQNHVFGCIRPQVRSAAFDQKDPYFHLSILPCHRPFLRFAFEGRAYQYPALRAVHIALCLHESSGGSPCSLERTGPCAFSTTSTTGSYWLSLRISYANTGNLVLSHLSQLGLWVNWEKSKLLPMQRISSLSMEFGFGQSDCAPHAERAQSALNCLNTFKNRTAAPLKQFQRLLGHMAAAAAVTPLGLLHMRPLQHWLHGKS